MSTPRNTIPTATDRRSVAPTGPALAALLVVVGAIGMSWADVLSRTGLDLSATERSRAVALVHAVLALAAGIWLLTATTEDTRRPRIAWRIIAAACVLFATGDVAWVVASTLRPELTAGADWYVALAPGAVALAVGLCVLPSSTTRVSARIRRLDVLIVVVATFTIIWARPAQAVAEQFGDSLRHVSAGQASVVDGPARFGLVLVLVAVTALARSGPGRAGQVTTAGGALLAVGAGVLLLSIDPLYGGDVGSISGALPIVAATLLLVTGARRSSPATEVDDRGIAQFELRVALPELATLLAILAITLRQFATNDLNVVGVTLGALVVALSISRLARLEYEQRQLTASLRSSAERLFRDARTDSLTQLGNRLSLDEYLTEQFGNVGRRGHSEGIAVFCIDVDHFKHINDALGHHVGDVLLTEVAQRLRVVFGEHIYRVGGDEFVAVRAHIDADSARAVATAAVDEARRPVEAEGHDLAVSASIGLAHLDASSPEDDPTPIRADELLRRADLALYRAKELGRNRWAGYVPSLQERADRHRSVQEALSRALDEDEMDVFARPVVDLGSGQVVGAAARLRWRSPVFGLLAPDDFLHDAIEGGMLQSLDRLLFTAIGKLLPRLVDEHGLEWISCTLSRHEVVHPGLVDLVSECVRSERGRLRIEVSESTVVDETARRSLDSLIASGVHITVARFGTGPSSMLSLDRYPASTIKIDPSFTAGIGRRREDTVIVNSVAGLGSDLGLELAADGIDEDLQARMLIDLGFTLGEGRLFGASVPLAEFLDTVGRRPADGAGGVAHGTPVRVGDGSPS